MGHKAHGQIWEKGISSYVLHEKWTTWVEETDSKAVELFFCNVSDSLRGKWKSMSNLCYVNIVLSLHKHYNLISERGGGSFETITVST